MARNTVPVDAPEHNGAYTEDAEGAWNLSEARELALQEMDNAAAELVVREDEIDIDAIPTFTDRAKEAKMAVHKSTRDLLGHDLILVRWREQEALLENTGEITKGYFVVGIDLTAKGVFSVFFGGVALLRTLRNVKPPMRCTIEKHGRTLVFK